MTWKFNGEAVEEEISLITEFRNNVKNASGRAVGANGRPNVFAERRRSVLLDDITAFADPQPI